MYALMHQYFASCLLHCLISKTHTWTMQVSHDNIVGNIEATIICYKSSKPFSWIRLSAGLQQL